MEKKIGLAILLALVLVLSSFGLASAGIEPSPFQPEINQLHSVELNVAAINKRLEKLNESETPPEGSENYLRAMAHQMDILSARVAETLLTLPSPSLINPYDGQDEVLLSLDGIRFDSGGINNITVRIQEKMGIGPSPFYGSIKLIQDIEFHFIPILHPPTIP